MKDKEYYLQYIGSKVKGFKFEQIGDLFFNPQMNNFIGEVGMIIKVLYSPKDHETPFGYLLTFSNGAAWVYPADQCIRNLSIKKTVYLF